MKRTFPWIILLLSLCGLLTSGYLSYQHYRILSGQMDRPSFCSFGPSFNCDAVNLSKYAEIFGYPVSSLGLALYLTLALFSLYMIFFKDDLAKHFLSWVILLSAMALLADLYFAAVLIWRIKVFCMLCIATYAFNLSIFLLAFFHARFIGLKGLKFRLNTIPKSLFFFAYSTQVLLILISVLLTFTWEFKSQAGESFSKKELNDKLKTWVNQQEKVYQNFEIDSSPRKGPANAPVTIVEFSDFQCPYCKKAALYLHTVFDANRDHLQIVFKNYPLDMGCNPKITHEMHQKACFFARAAICAEKQGKFWEMHDLLFAEGEQINYTNMGEKAGNLGLNKSDFAQCLESMQAKMAIDRDLQLGDRIGISSTPTIFINNRRLPGLVPPKVLQSLIDLELAEKK